MNAPSTRILLWASLAFASVLVFQGPCLAQGSLSDLLGLTGEGVTNDDALGALASRDFDPTLLTFSNGAATGGGGQGGVANGDGAGRDGMDGRDGKNANGGGGGQMPKKCAPPKFKHCAAPVCPQPRHVVCRPSPCLVDRGGSTNVTINVITVVVVNITFNTFFNFPKASPFCI